MCFGMNHIWDPVASSQVIVVKSSLWNPGLHMSPHWCQVLSGSKQTSPQSQLVQVWACLLPLILCIHCRLEAGISFSQEAQLNSGGGGRTGWLGCVLCGGRGRQGCPFEYPSDVWALEKFRGGKYIHLNSREGKPIQSLTCQAAPPPRSPWDKKHRLIKS